MIGGSEPNAELIQQTEQIGGQDSAGDAERQAEAEDAAVTEP